MSSHPKDLHTENLALDSILRTLEELPLCFSGDDDTNLDPRLFAHIHNDIRIRGTTLEGNSFTNVILHFYRFLEFIQNPNNLTQLVEEDQQSLQLHTKKLKEKFTFLLKIEAKCNEIREAGVKDRASIPKLKNDIETCTTQIIEQLNQQGTVIIAGGWNGIYEAGHALSYKFSKQKEGENEAILFTVYNTGAGLEYHLKITDTVDKYWPLLTYRIPLQKDKLAYEIQQKELALFITRLLKARIEPAWVRKHGDTLTYSKDRYSYEEYREISTPLNAKKMYREVFDKLIELGGDIIDPDYNQFSLPYLFTHAQWSGTCSLRNILALVREEFPTLASFELLLFQYRFQTIIDFYRNSERNKQLSKAVVFEQLYPALKNFAGFCKKLIHQQKPPFQRSENNAKQVFTFLNAIKSVLDKINKTNQLESKIQQEDYHSISMENLPTHFRMYQSFGGIADPKPCEPIKFNATVTDSLPVFNNIESYHHYLSKCIKQLIEYKNRDHSLHVIIELEKLVFQFPLKSAIDCIFKLNPKNNKETEETLLNCLDSLQLLRKLYAEQCAKVKNLLFAERALTNYCILAFEKRIIEAIFKYRKRNPTDINNFLTCMLNFEYNLTRRIKNDLESPFCSHYTPELDDIIDTISEIFTPDKSQSEQYSINERYELQLINMHSLKECFQELAHPHYRFKNNNPICVLYDFANGNFKYCYRDYFEDPKLQEKINTILSDFALCLRFRESIRDTHFFQTTAFTSLTNHVLTDENRLKNVKHEVVYQGNYGWFGGDGVLLLKDSFSPNYLTDLNDSIKHLSSAYPPIKNSNIEYTLTSEANSLNSNDIITRMGSYKDFLHSVLFTRVTSQTQLIATLDLISKNIEALRNQDIQTLLQLNLFTPRLLKQQLKRTPEFSIAVISFIEQGIEYYSKNIGNNKKFDPTTLFLFKLAIPFKQTVIKLMPNEITTKIAISRLQDLEKILDDTINFNEALIRSALTPQIRSEIESTLKDLYAIKLLQLGTTLPFTAKVTHKFAVQVITQNLYQHILHNSEDPSLSHHLEQYQIAKTMEKLRKPLQHLFENLTLNGKCNLLNSILNKASLGELLPLNKIKWDKFDFPVVSGTWEQEYYQINLYTGNIQTTNCIVVPLPRYFYTNEFLELFGKMPRKVKLWTYPTRSNEIATTAEFIEDRQRYRVRYWERSTIHELTVEKFVEKSQTWFSLLKGSDYTGYRSFLPQSLFCNGEKVWRVTHSSNEQQQIIKLIITDKNNKTKYEGRGPFDQLSLWSMTTKEEQENSLVNVFHAIEKNDYLFNLLAKFEDPNYIEAWLEPKEKVLNIKLPRFGLEFRSETTGNGNIDFVWLKDPRYKIKMSKTSLPINDFDLFLTLETRCTKTLKEIVVLIPELQFNASEKICTDGFHYKPAFTFENKNIPNKKTRYYHLYSLEESDLKAKHAIGNLYLAYIYLVYHQFHESYHALTLFCNAVGTLSKHELELLRRILSKPKMVLASSSETLTPEKIAVQILAASILNNFMSIQTTTLGFNEEENSDANPYTAINSMGLLLEETLKKFYEVNFAKELVKLLTIHNNMRGKIPTHMRLNFSDELSLFKCILSKIQRFPYTALYHRFQSLNIRFLLKEKRQLQASSTNPKALSFANKARIQELDSSLRKNANLLTRNTKFKTFAFRIIPNGKEMINREIHECIYLNYSRYSSNQNPLLPLSMSITEASFYYKFPALYKLAKTPLNETNTVEKGYLKFFIQGKLRYYLNANYHIILDDPETHKKDLSLCCQQLIETLYYVVENPEHPWPEYENYYNNQLYYSSLLTIQNEAIKLFKQKPLELTISVTQPQDCSLFREINKSLSLPKPIAISTSTDNHVYCLITELQLSEFYQAYTKCSEALYKKDIKGEEEQMTLMNKTALDSEPYLLSQTQHFKDELNRGKLINQRTVAENELFVNYLFDKKNQAKILEYLNHKDSGIIAVDAQLKELENTLLNFANSKLNTSLASLHTRFSVLSDKHITISLRDLFTLYLQGDIQQYTKTTFLDNEAARKLHQEMHHYLCKLSHQKHRKRVYQLLKIINKLDEQHPDYINLLHRLGRELVAKRSYNEQQHPELLVFEIIEDLLLRPEQTAILNRMLSKSDNYYNNVFIQLIMGGGKSKVLEPLLAIKKANGTNLVIIEVPQSLFETNFSDINEVITRISNIKPVPFLFERRSFSYPEYLEKLYEKLNQCIISRGFLVTTPESIKSMQLKYQELLYSQEVFYLSADNTAKKIYSNSLFMFEKILKLLKTRGDAILSEPDVALDPKRELIYNIAGEESINLADRSTLVKIHACLDKIEVPSKERKCTLDQVSNESNLISSETEWKGAFSNFAVFLVYNPGSPLKYLTLLTDDEKEVICHYLLNQKVHNQRGVSLQYQTILNKLTLPQRNELALIKGELSEILPLTLKRKKNVHFGLSHDPKNKNQGIAIPYKGNNTPNENSEFGSPFESACYTLRLMDKTPLTSEILITMITDFKLRANQQISESRLIHNRGLTCRETDTAKEFLELVGVALDDVDETNSRNISKLLNMLLKQKRRKVFEYCWMHYVLNKIQRHNLTLRSDGQNHVSQFKTVQGMSGTLDDYRAFHQNILFDPSFSQGTDGITLDHLERHVSTITQTHHTSAAHFLAENFKAAKSDSAPIHSIIDVGAVFSGQENIDVAHSIKQFLNSINSSIQFILYFNKNHTLCALSLDNRGIIEIGNSKPKLIAEKLGLDLGNWSKFCFTYYDQVHTRGIDILQPMPSTGILTIGLITGKDDLLQGAMRLRDLANSQRIQIAIPKEVAEAMPAVSSFTWKIVRDMTLDVHKVKVAENNLRSIPQKLHNVIHEHLFYTILLKEKDLAKKLSLAQIFKPVFVTQQSSDALTLFGEIDDFVATQSLIAALKKEKLELWESMLHQANIKVSMETRAKIEQTMEKICSQAHLYCLSKTKSTNIHNKDSRIELQTQTSKQKEKEKDLEAQREYQSNSLLPKEMVPWNISLLNLKMVPESSSKDHHESCQIFYLNTMLGYSQPSFFSKNLLVSENFAYTCRDQMSFMGKHTKPVFFTLFIEEQSSSLNALIITSEEAEIFLEKYNKEKDEFEKSGRKLWIVSPYDHYLVGSTSKIMHPDYIKLKEQICYFNGDPDELTRLYKKTAWIKEDRPVKLNYLEKVILNVHPGRQRFMPQFMQHMQKKDDEHQALQDKLAKLKILTSSAT